MKILHVANLPLEANGITEVLYALTKEQYKLGHDVKVCSFQLAETDNCIDYFVKLEDTNHLKEITSQFSPDIVIFHGLYHLKFISTAKFLIKMNVPYSIVFHGAASPQNRNKSRWKKMVADILFFNKFIKKAHGVIYLNNEERDSSVFSNLSRQSVLIPNGINKISDNIGRNNSQIEIVYLSRIDYNHKGLDILISAIRKIARSPIASNIRFSFYGSGKDVNKFQSDIQDIDIVNYKGAVYGDEKEQAFLSADIFILTSRYEGMPISILEALSYGLPCIITRQTNMASIINEGCGWITELDPDNISATIEQAVENYRHSKQAYRKACYIQAKRFEWHEVAKISIAQYEKLLIS